MSSKVCVIHLKCNFINKQRLLTALWKARKGLGPPNPENCYDCSGVCGFEGFEGM